MKIMKSLTHFSVDDQIKKKLVYFLFIYFDEERKKYLNELSQNIFVYEVTKE